MFNLKIPYIVYPMVLGLMSGWLVSTVIAGKSVVPKPLPSPKIKNDIKKTPLSEIAGMVIDKNMFALSISPIPQGAIGGDTGTVATTAPFNGKLIGLIQNPKNKAGIAIINVENQTLSLRTGGEKEGLKLISIDNITAVIEKSGRQYSLILEGGGNSLLASQATSSAVSADTGGNLNISIPRSEIQSELKDLNKVLQSALVSPLYNNGAFVGYKVTRMKDDSPLKKLGLNQNDVITRINGSDLKTPEILFNMLSQIDDISAISIDMIRDNDKKTLFVELQ